MKHDMLEHRIARLEARAEIAELCSAYCIACDDRDMPALRALFTDDIVMHSDNGTMLATGADETMAMFDRMLAIRGPSFHWTHDRFVRFDEHALDTASGTVLAHAETTPNGIVSIAAIRYADQYRRVAGRWLFARRSLSFLYYLPMHEYLERLGKHERFFGPAGWQMADFPETLTSWTAFYGSTEGK